MDRACAKMLLRQGWTVRAECINTRKRSTRFRTGFVKNKYGLFLGIVKIAVLGCHNQLIIWLFLKFA